MWILDDILRGKSMLQDFAQANEGIIPGDEVADYLLNKRLSGAELKKMNDNSVIILAKILTTAAEKANQMQQNQKSTQYREAAMLYFSVAVDRGSSEAQFEFGNWYSRAGVSISTDPPKQAFYYWQMAAQSESPCMPAVYQVAKCYAEGLGTVIDWGLYAENLTRSAESFGPAAYELSQNYKTGVKKDGYDVFVQDRNKYMSYLRKALNLGHALAAKEMALSLQDPLEQLYCYQIAAANGDHGAKAILMAQDPAGILRGLLEQVIQLRRTVQELTDQINLLKNEDKAVPKKSKDGATMPHGIFSVANT